MTRTMQDHAGIEQTCLPVGGAEAEAPGALLHHLTEGKQANRQPDEGSEGGESRCRHIPAGQEGITGCTVS